MNFFFFFSLQRNLEKLLAAESDDNESSVLENSEHVAGMWPSNSLTTKVFHFIENHMFITTSLLGKAV